MIDVRYFAAARAAAGVSAETVPAAETLGALCAYLVDRHPASATPEGALPLETVLGKSSYLLDGRGVGDLAAARDEPLGGVKSVDVLPPFAGG